MLQIRLQPAIQCSAINAEYLGRPAFITINGSHDPAHVILLEHLQGGPFGKFPGRSGNGSLNNPALALPDAFGQMLGLYGIAFTKSVP